ncbi:CLUMA_CG021076, isoform A [Clunio marinus]|uniref:CLUMA_CG021076, isoform A n=1 Tax=Clunio marinus TaxID=568069 RepID=A0A1J1J737_9DIPT|nr:CLUMA_CG021076, isoform A [Clunio marinus]
MNKWGPLKIVDRYPMSHCYDLLLLNHSDLILKQKQQSVNYQTNLKQGIAPGNVSVATKSFFQHALIVLWKVRGREAKTALIKLKEKGLNNKTAKGKG